MRCVIAGGGPAGAVLALLLARAGVEVTLLEKHADFLRDFRGDTIHPSTLQVLDELGLAEAFHRIPHRKAYGFDLVTDTGRTRISSLRDLPGPYNYIAFVPQWDFLTLITTEAATYPNFRLLMNAEAVGLIREGDAVRGLRYRDAEGEHELRAEVTIAADGRGSTLRAAAGLVPKELGAPMDVVWFRMPREDGDPGEAFLRVSAGHMMVAINRETYWQLGYVIPKGGAERLRAAGVGELRRQVGRLLPFLGDRTEAIAGFEDVSVLTVALNRLERWYRPGFLCIGDAAHAMSPVFGVGINLAVQDAVATANILLSEGPSALPKVQRRRMFPTKATQLAQQVAQRRLIQPALSGSVRPTGLPDLAALPVVGRLVGRLLARFIGHGVRPEHVSAK
ncbi:FAD-dependent oxidoreductase [Nonomuraea dietziae]|uniref:2-polyprenyl-6-methoxyphenol hydroxylase-like FAD-dependent oxidoreductase n=1 Tax=Nonomuraea dietziae TaxID=65515 RepID=A0A7W5YC09_9ACTN|nr:FAD-dependent oxidoreductase [Nonomuraea dietziae]MBB3732618.1 2-polyprenyl-6-methoxyphenol hydroxylase-like FAD-dependent oxidoreductase [Nonomuraea dietziae]